ncbi:MAG: 50S ribosomal protein L23 [Parcubacteria group bacterium RIFCSPHIGHO2_01_FULL_47_10b]|nr:MAG: 50S ribosomal protein L23 [Parcubacteria group bacterium RIFCSPHIGHO2_01_FULL_47_10b]
MEKASKKKVGAANVTILGVVKKPYTTEKTTRLQKFGIYTFQVSPTATKVSIAQAVEQYYGVHVRSVRITHRKPKIKRIRGRIGITAGMKKALVTLKTGERIESLTA